MGLRGRAAGWRIVWGVSQKVALQELITLVFGVHKHIKVKTNKKCPRYFSP